MNTAKLTSLTIAALLLSQSVIAAEAVEESKQVKPNSKVDVSIQRGNVTFKSWDKSEISVKGQLDELSEGFTFTVKGGNVVIEDKMPRQYNGSNKDGSELTITLPSQIKLQAEGVSANYTLSTLNGKISISSVSGDIRATQLSKKVMIRTVSGDILSRDLSGKVMLETVSGEIKDTDSDGQIAYSLVSGELTATTKAAQVSVELVSGDATVTLANVDNLNIKSVSGDLDVSLNSLNDRAKLASVSGDMSIQFISKANVSFDINGGPSGKISNKLTDDKVTKEKYSPQTYLKFQSGDGSAKLSASTISGDIALSH
ncbi:DUF4097 family beta strand repeat-containing protein [Shewanella gelidimarina]|uniref:DUF4097 family beta strand repeat-containing protein n=1 Tax=Shewanella gelidimarina TaxID=56813 RepID=UPI00200F598B|nr:DUF4097 family beta strand repeat-containing protein [Shewanella gelidimarina]MCL1056868.1 DUF4097 family beta strand repeat-containing protein [Shewanella gelidimarina]